MCLEVPVAVAYRSKCRLKCKPSWADETIRLTSISPTEKGHFRGGGIFRHPFNNRLVQSLRRSRASASRRGDADCRYQFCIALFTDVNVIQRTIPPSRLMVLYSPSSKVPDIQFSATHAYVELSRASSGSTLTKCRLPSNGRHFTIIIITR